MESVTQSDLESFLEPNTDGPGESEIDPLEGIIFDPTDQESIRILELRASDPHFYYPPIHEADVYRHEPNELQGLPAIHSNENMYFFCVLTPLDASGERYRRYTKTGTWKVTCNSVIIKDKHTHEEIRKKRTLVFYKNSPDCAKGVRTNWMMYEYSAYANSNNSLFKNLVVCRIKEDKDKDKGKEKKGKEKKKKEDKKRCISTKIEYEPAKKRPSSTNDVFQPEPHLPPRCYLITNPRSDAVENTNPDWNYFSVPNVNNHAVEDTSQVDALPLENLNVLNGSTRLDETSFYTQRTILPEQGSSSSCVSIIENEVLNSSCGNQSQGEDWLGEWESVALDEIFSEETGYTRGFYGGESSDVGTEIYNAWVDEPFWNNNLGACVNHI